MTRTPDPYEIVGKNWPLDGPYTPEDLAAAFGAMSELTRWSNHATSSTTSAALPTAPEVYPALGSLVGAVGGLRQLFEQLGQWAESLPNDRSLTDSRAPGDHDKATMTAVDASMAFEEAARLAERLRELVDRAQNRIGHLYHEPQVQRDS